jgi:hypothetical protein
VPRRRPEDVETVVVGTDCAAMRERREKRERMLRRGRKKEG